MTVARLKHSEIADLDAAYGEALVAQRNGAVSDEADERLQRRLEAQSQRSGGALLLGQAQAEHGDKQGALALWQGLLAETPANAPLHQTLVDRIALLTAQSGAPAARPIPGRWWRGWRRS